MTNSIHDIAKQAAREAVAERLEAGGAVLAKIKVETSDAD